MTASRIAGVLALLLVLAAVIWLLFLRGPRSHEYTMVFENSGQLVKGGDVRVAGRRIGSIKGVGLTKDNLAQIKVSVDEPYAPLRKGTTAAIRATSLSGQANRYIALSLGPNNADELDDGTILMPGQTTSIVDLDQLFATLDPKTRKGLQDVIRGSSVQYGKDGGKRANEALKYFSPTLSSLQAVMGELNRDQQALEDMLVNGARVSQALSESRQLGPAVRTTSEAMDAVAQESAALDQVLAELPTTLRRGNTTFVNVRATLEDLDVLVSATKPVAPRLRPFFARLRPLMRDTRPTIRDVRRLITRRGDANDLIDLLERQPRLAQVSGPALRHGAQALRESTPVLQFVRPYAPDLIGWSRNFGHTTANYDANGHYARIAPVTDAFSFERTATGARLTGRAPSARRNALQIADVRRCPGGAAAPVDDGSNPWAPEGSDCNLASKVPGP